MDVSCIITAAKGTAKGAAADAAGAIPVGTGEIRIQRNLEHLAVKAVLQVIIPGMITLVVITVWKRIVIAHNITVGIVTQNNTDGKKQMENLLISCTFSHCKKFQNSLLKNCLFF